MTAPNRKIIGTDVNTTASGSPSSSSLIIRPNK
nr:MAG TPA: hypothetical protein [Caudoviricetes sp.]